MGNRLNGKRFPLHGWIGLGLIALFWPLNWLLEGPRTQWGFFPLWLGYSLLVDGLNVYCTGTSLLRRDAHRFGLLFVFSIPGWWLFELLNARLQNWEYVGRELFTDVEFFLWASLSFSTVMPAVFETAEFVSSWGWVRRLPGWRVLRPTPRLARSFIITGLVMLSVMLAWPRYFFPVLWLSIFFILEPVNIWLGYRSLLDWTAAGNWRPVVSLSIGALICGFIWEMWNYFSFPKWVYHVPFFQFWQLFEMPLMGYLGYLPFSLELVALYHLICGVVGDREGTYLELS